MTSGLCPRRLPLVVALVVLAAAMLPLDSASRVSGATTAVEPATCSPRATTPAGLDFSGKRLEYEAFSGRDLRNANFEGATLVGVSFIHARLQGANFRNAVMLSGPRGSMTMPVDFTGADLDNACFIGAQFSGRTYFTAANLSGTDFSQQDLTAGKAIFGDQPMRIADPARRPIFRGVTMNCEFFGQWNRIDLSDAVLTACSTLYATKPGAAQGHDFSGAVMNGVSFENMDLSRSRWSGAQLAGARFTNAILDDATGLSGTGPNDTRLLAGAVFTRASLLNVDLSYAQLYGANFTNAEMSRVNLTGAYLGQGGGVDVAASFDGAHMKFVNLTNADLTGTSFQFASLYANGGRSSPGWRCSTDVASCPATRTGATCSCATAAGATLTGANFSNAFLYGVDFGGATTTLRGTNFSGAVLVAASFSGATIAVEPDPGRATTFSGALLHGADLSGTRLFQISFNNASVDFGVTVNGVVERSNTLYLQLPNGYTAFKNWSPTVGGSGTTCVALTFMLSTTMPALDENNTCPDGTSNADGCGPQLPGPNPNPRFKAFAPPLQGVLRFPGTYPTAGESESACNRSTVEPAW